MSDETNSQMQTEPGSAQPSLTVEVVFEDGDWSELKSGGAEPIEDIVEATAAALKARMAADLDESGNTATLALTSDDHVARLNETFRGKTGPTNVLSFPDLADPTPQNTAPESGTFVFLGDIVMAEQTVAKEALELKIPLRHHFKHLLVHGLLHLLGYDHETDDEASKMEALEVEILERLGIPDPYAGQI